MHYFVVNTLKLLGCARVKLCGLRERGEISEGRSINSMVSGGQGCGAMEREKGCL